MHANPLTIVIIGGVAGGASAAARARRLSETANIILIERGPHVSFANCGLPYRVGGEIAETSKLLLQTPESFRSRYNIDVRVNTEATSINRETRTVLLRDLPTGREITQSYDRLILATGAAPLMPPIPGINRAGNFMVRNVPDIERIMAWLEKTHARRAVVVGGGYIGLEMAEQLHRRGLQIAIAEALPQVMSPLDVEMAAFLHNELRRNKIDLHLGDGVAGFEEPREGEVAAASVVVLNSGVRLPADVVILGLGVRPEVMLPRDARLEPGERGGIRVNDHMQTSDVDIYAVGDAVEVRDGVTGEWALVPLAGPANRQGRIAADHIFGIPSRYKATFGTAVLRLFSLTAACTGANEKALQRAKIEYQAVHLHPGSHAGYYPGARPIALKLLFSPKTGKILGAQAVGEDGVDKRIDVIATALQGGLTIDDLAELELSYAPPFGSAKDPVNMAGMIAQNSIRGDVPLVQWHEIAAGRNGSVLLDVRDPVEWERGHIPGAMHIPLNELRGRLDEVPRGKKVIAYCHSGQRSNSAVRILRHNGYDAANLTGSWRTWSTANG